VNAGPRGGASSLGLSRDDGARVARVEALARSGSEGVGPLLDLLVDPSWAVRRAVVDALAGAEASVDGLCDVLVGKRDHEGRIAAVVDALVASRGEVDSRMMALAKGDAHAVACDAIQVLGRRRVQSAIGLLTTLSTHGDDNIAVGSIEALGRIGGLETVDALIAAVEARHFFRTFPAIDALGRTGDARAVAPLEVLLADPLYAPEAVRALGRTGDESAVAPLAALLVSPIAATVRLATAALAELRERYDARFGDNEAIRRELPQSVDAGAASAYVIESLSGAAPSELVASARVLGWLADDVAIAYLVEMIVAEAPVGPAAAGALRRLGSRATRQLLAAIRDGKCDQRLRLLPIVGYAAGSIDDLLPCLDDEDAGVRVRACEALARLGNPVAVSSLFRHIGALDGRVAHAAAAAIQSLGSVETKQLALEHGRSADTRTRRAALRIISYFGYPEGLEVLIDALQDEDEKIRDAAIYGLPLIDDPRGTDALLAASSHPVARTRAAVMRALGQTSNQPNVVAALRASLDDVEPWTRYYACQALGRLRVEEACPAIVSLMNDPSGQVRVAAVEALAHLKDQCGVSALARAAKADDPDMRRAALLGLGISRRPESIALLREAASAQDSSTRLVAIGALSQFHGPDVVPTLAHAASDPDDAVRSAAIGYLSTRPGADATAALVEQLANSSGRDRVLEALAVAADSRVEGVLLALETADGERAQLLVAALTRMRRPSSQAAMVMALAFDNVHARRAAAAALAALGTAEAHEALLLAGSADADATVRRICAAVERI
jgi:HEAT repeat protein